MTRLTDEQVLKLWAETEAPHIRTFADRIAALAVQEVERGVDPCYKQESEMAWAALGQDVTRAFNPSELGSEILKLRAALAEVTKERDFYRLDAERHAQFADSYRAQLSSDKREALVPCRECAGSGLVPATPSPEAREEDSEFLLRVVQEVNAYAVITPADAKRIVAMARTGGTE
jgi:hypothetical protein